MKSVDWEPKVMVDGRKSSASLDMIRCSVNDLFGEDVEKEIAIPTQKYIVAVHHLAYLSVQFVEFSSYFWAQVAYEMHI